MKVDTTTFVREHGHAPRGRGGWIFIMGAIDFERIDETDRAGRPLLWHAPGGLTFSEAKKLAAAEAKSRGVKLVGVAP